MYLFIQCTYFVLKVSISESVEQAKMGEGLLQGHCLESSQRVQTCLDSLTESLTDPVHYWIDHNATQ